MYLSHEFRKDFLRVDNYYVATYNRRDGFVEEPPGTHIEVLLPTYNVEFYYPVEEEGVKEYLNMIFFNYIDGKSAVYAHEELEDIDCMSILEESALSDTSRFRLCQSE